MGFQVVETRILKKTMCVVILNNLVIPNEPISKLWGVLLPSLCYTIFSLASDCLVAAPEMIKTESFL